MRHPIAPDRIYWVTLDNRRVRVRSIRPLPTASWECEVLHDGRIVIVSVTDDWNLEPLLPRNA